MILFGHKILQPWLSSGANVVTPIIFYPVLLILGIFNAHFQKCLLT